MQEHLFFPRFSFFLYLFVIVIASFLNTNDVKAGELSTFLSPSVTISAPNSIQPPGVSLYANTINNPIYKIQIDVTGANVTLDGVQLSTSGSYTSSDVVRFKLFRTSTSSFNASHPVGTPITSTSTGSGETLNFTSLSTTLSVGTHYIWLAADITISPDGSRTLQVNAFTPSSDILFLETIDLTSGTVNNGNLFFFNPTIGLYYSNNNSTDFTNTSGWGTNPDGTGSTPFPPAFTSGNVSFFINNGHTKDANTALIDIKSLIVEGTFQDNNVGGINTFNGLVEVKSTGQFIPNQSDHFFGGGIFNSGIFSIGDVEVTFNGSQDVIANNQMTFGGKIIISSQVNLHGTLFYFTKTGVDHSINQPLNNYATVTVDGGLSGLSTWKNYTGSVLNYNSTNSITCILDVSSSGNLVEYGNSSNQTIKATTYHHLKLSGGGTKSLAGAITVNGNLLISSGVILDAANSSYHINLNGNWTNNGTFLPASNTVTFSSTTNPQTITGTTTFYDLVINNTHSSTPTVTLNDAITVTYNLNLNNGRLVLGDYDVSLTNPVV
ncbi:MAG: hypothetical protein RMJ89_04785, partial [Flammeovirgaceae bacterium]|nr:hypothetical protein [Flammeovirgaceae bacterium]